MRKLNTLTNADIVRFAPSVFAEEPAPGASSRYQFVRTADVIDTMRSEGWEVVQASQSRTLTADKRPYAKHLVRLVHRDYLEGKLQVGDYVPELAITNSHNRTSAYEMMAALKVLACLNGLMLPSREYGRIRVLHNDPRMMEHIIDGTDLVREVHTNHALPRIEKMRAIELSKQQAVDFATGATLLKWGEKRPDHVDGLLAVRRAEDDNNTLWSVFNRVQENAVKGGYASQDRAGRNVVTPGINSVNRDIDFNAGIWTFANRVLDIVAA
jgi:hypothetical protein